MRPESRWLCSWAWSAGDSGSPPFLEACAGPGTVPHDTPEALAGKSSCRGQRAKLSLFPLISLENNHLSGVNLTPKLSYKNNTNKG